MSPTTTIADDQAPNPQSPRDQRTYFVSDDRLRAFAQLTPLQRLQWVEQCSLFVRLGQMAARNAVAASQHTAALEDQVAPFVPPM